MKKFRALATLVAVFCTLALAAPAATAGTSADTTPPTKPTNFRVVFATADTIRLAWDPATDDSGVAIHEIFVDGNFEMPLTWDAHDGQFDVKFNRTTGLIPGSTHTFVIRVEDPSGNATMSDTIRGTFADGDNTPPTAPGNLREVSQDANGIRLAWDPSVDENDFKYHVDGTLCSLEVTDTAAFVPSAAADPFCGFIVPGNTYRLSVRAIDVWRNVSAPSTVTVDFQG